MGEFSCLWALLIVVITICIYKIIKPLINGKKNRLVWLVLAISICVYSGIGIAYSNVKKVNIFYYIIYLTILGFSFSVFCYLHFYSVGHHPYACKRPEEIETSDEDFWNADFTSKVFIFVFFVYFLFRFASLIYPENKLSSLSLTYDAVNNLKNISGENTTIFVSLAAYTRPFAYIGMYYAFKRVRYVAIFLFADIFITLLYSGYLSRSYIICVLFIVLMLYFNNDLSDDFLSLNTRRRRIVLTLGILTPIVIYIMIFLMTIRTTGNTHWTVLSFFSSEIDYPKYYDSLKPLEGTIISPKDMLLHILDSFVPIIPTPKYTGNFNVLFSERISGVSMKLSWFNVFLPSILGEARIIFGDSLFWIHAIIIAFMSSMITRIVGDNQKKIILYYYFLTCVMKAARAGYAEISSTIMFDIIIIDFFIWLLKAFYYSAVVRGRYYDPSKLRN